MVQNVIKYWPVTSKHANGEAEGQAQRRFTSSGTPDGVRVARRGPKEAGITTGQTVALESGLPGNPGSGTFSHMAWCP